MDSHDEEDCYDELFTDIKTEICAKPCIKINVLEKSESTGPSGNKISMKVRDMYSKTDDNIRIITQYPQIIIKQPHDIVSNNTSQLELRTNKITDNVHLYQKSFCINLTTRQ